MAFFIVVASARLDARGGKIRDQARSPCVGVDEIDQ
jgi:hypothetical protein